MSISVLPYFKKHRNIIEQNILLSEDPDNIEAIHDLRLSIKRLRVVVQFCATLDQSYPGDMPGTQELNAFFRRAGKLRDVQVIRALLADYDPGLVQALLEKLGQKEKRQRKKYEKSVRSFRLECLDEMERAIRDQLSPLPLKKGLAGAVSLLSMMMEDIRESFHASKREKRFHDIRRQIKNMVYLNNMFDDQIPLSETTCIAADRLRELGTLAGNWHDHLIMQGEISSYIREHKDARADKLQPFVEEIRLHKARLQQEYACILMNEMKI